jgi:hypothetical protein
MKSKRPSFRTSSGYLLAVLILACLTPDAQCQERDRKHQFIMYLTAPTKTPISETKSSALNIGDKAWTMEVGVQTKLWGLIGISGALGYGGAKDNGSFTQSTTWGDLESSFTTLSYDFKVGMWTPPLNLIKGGGLNFSAAGSVGYEGFSGTREIVNCEDCEKEKYSFKGGFFVEPEISFYFYQDLFGVGTSYRYFLGDGDLNGSWTILKLMVRFDLINKL